jgi:hypothetical protein
VRNHCERVYRKKRQEGGKRRRPLPCLLRERAAKDRREGVRAESFTSEQSREVRNFLQSKRERSEHDILSLYGERNIYILYASI